MNKLKILKAEAINLTANLIKVGIWASVSKLTQNIYNIQVNSTLQHVSSDLQILTDRK